MTNKLIPSSLSFEVRKNLLSVEDRKKWEAVEYSVFLLVMKEYGLRKNSSQKTINKHARPLIAGMQQLFNVCSKYFSTQEQSFFDKMAVKMLEK
jgi:hypothetical protein